MHFLLIFMKIVIFTPKHIFRISYMHDSHRIAVNTLMLYIRMFILLIVGLYASRVVLAALGENDYGVYNVVGGVVSMFTIISGTLSTAVTRFITFYMGKGDADRLDRVYSSAVMVQLILAVIVIAVAEPAGLWFIDHKMTIDPERLPAARWVLQFSLLSFVFNLMSVPQMALITAHEKMSAYAYIGLLDGLLRLAAALSIAHSSSDRLILYSALMAASVLLVRIAYAVYCKVCFEEIRFRPVLDTGLLRQMFSFAGWNFIGVTSGVLRDHGGNLLVNLFFGTAVNAARGIAVQLNGAIQGFVTNFMTAVNPQITKSYAAGERDYMLSLVMRSSRLSYCLLLFIALPVLCNTGYILDIWLEEVPAQTVIFVQLFLVFALSESLSQPLVTAQLATGNIRDYQIIVGGLQLMNLPVSYVLLKNGAPAESTVAVAIVISQLSLVVRLLLLRKMVGISPGSFFRSVYMKVIAVTAVAAVLPVTAGRFLPSGLIGFCISLILCVACSGVSVLYLGLTPDERRSLRSMVLRRFYR